jgi:hypothetical protein
MRRTGRASWDRGRGSSPSPSRRHAHGSTLGPHGDRVERFSRGLSRRTGPPGPSRRTRALEDDTTLLRLECAQRPPRAHKSGATIWGHKAEFGSRVLRTLLRMTRLSPDSLAPDLDPGAAHDEQSVSQSKKLCVEATRGACLMARHAAPKRSRLRAT